MGSDDEDICMKNEGGGVRTRKCIRKMVDEDEGTKFH